MSRPGRSGRNRAAERVVEVYVRAAGARRVASGYAVSGDLVLTSGHLVDAGDGATPEVQVRPLGETEWITDGVRVAWCRRDGAVDAALLRVRAAPWRALPDDGAVRWAVPAPGERVACAAIGFPAAQERPDGVRDTEEVAGTVSPGTRAKADRITVDVDSPVPAGENGWRGMSGAALLSARGRRLLGVVADEQGGFARRRLEATRVDELLADPDFAALAGDPPAEEIGADSPLPLDHRVLREPYERLPSRYPEAELLAPSHGVVPFLGRDDELERLLGWCRSDAALSVALVTGEGGAGKSRLAAELCRRIRADDDWDAYVADPERTGDDAWTGLDPDWPLLLVVDYPESMAPAVARVIAGLAARPAGPRVRVLLAARQAGAWWRAVNAETRGVLEAATDLRIALTPDGFGPGERARQAAAATAAFAGRLDVAPCPPPDVRDGAFDSPLLVHIAALLALHGDAPGTAGPGALRERLLDRLLDRERRRWARVQERRDGGVTGALGLGDVPAQQAVALATLAAPTRAEARALLRAVPDLADATAERRGQVADWLYRLYPAAAGEPAGRRRGAGDDRRAAGGEDAPDRGTAGVTQGAQGRGTAGVTQDPQGRGTAGVTQDPQRRGAADVTEDAYGGGAAGAEEPALAPLRPDLLVERLLATTPDLGPLLVALADQEACTPVHLFRTLHALRLAAGNAPAVHRALHTFLVARLRPLLVASVRAPRSPLPGLLDDCLAAAADDALAEAASAIGAGDANALPGRLAVTYARLVVRHRAAAGDSPEDRSEYAHALNALGSVLAETGRPDEAIAALRESAAVVEALPDSASKDDHLATVKHNLGMALAAAGRFDEARAETDAVVALRRRRYADDPGRRRFALAAGLRNHAMDLSDSGRHAEAVAAAQEAVDHFTVLAGAEPGPYEPQLADALGRLAFTLARAGKYDEALAASGRAVELFREVCADPARRNAWTYDAWAGALANYAADLADAGRHDDALAAADEAVALRETLADLDPERHGPGHAKALRLLAMYLDRAGSPGAALSVSERAADTSRRLADLDDTGDRLALARALQELGPRRLQAGDAPGAAAAAREAVSLLRVAGPAEAGTVRPVLAAALGDLAVAAQAAGDTGEALAAATEAVDLRRALAAGTDEAGPRAALVAALLGAGVANLSARRLADARAALGEAGALARAAADADPERGRSLLASTLNDVGYAYARADLHEEALLALNDALALRRELAARDPDTYLPGVAQTLHNIGTLFCAMGLVPAAVPLLEEAAELGLGRLAEGRPVNATELTGTVATLASVLILTGRPADALTWRRRLADLMTAGHAGPGAGAGDEPPAERHAGPQAGPEPGRTP